MKVNAEFRLIMENIIYNEGRRSLYILIKSNLCDGADILEALT